MDDVNLTDVDSTDLDSNQEPTVRSVERIESMLNELATAHERIEDRIRMLERVTDRARHRGRRPPADRNPTEINHQSSGERGTIEAIAERGNGIGCKRDSSHLVAKALKMESMVKKDDDKEGGSFYDCNICLDLAKEPVLTCCGHLFCWACFYQVSEIDSSCKECPVCKGEVSDRTMIPIYGNGGGDRVSVTESGLMIPPRPKARRVESVRQHVLNHGPPHVPVTEALRRIIGAVDHQTQAEDGAVDHQAEATTSSSEISLPRTPYFLRRRSMVLRTLDGDGESRDRRERRRRRLN